MDFASSTPVKPWQTTVRSVQAAIVGSRLGEVASRMAVPAAAGAAVAFVKMFLWLG